MNPLTATVTVFQFEWRRAWTIARMAWWAVLAALPIFITVMIRIVRGIELPDRAWSGILFALGPMLVSMLGSFLWSTTAVSGELEQKSWVYLAVRPHGAIVILLGKFLTSISWVLSAAITGLTVAALLTGVEDLWELWWPLAIVTLLAVPAYSSIYLCIGCVYPRRAMVLAIAYSLPLELLVSFIPAVINKFTIQYRLRSLVVSWSDIPLEDARFFRSLAFVGEEETYWHLIVLAAVIVSMVVIAISVLRWREFSTAEEAET